MAMKVDSWRQPDMMLSTMSLGATVRAARKTRDMSLADTQEALKELLIDCPVSQLARMEDGSRPGDPRVWGGLWRLFRLPLNSLYEGLHLPTPPLALGSVTQEIVAAVEPLPEETQRVALGLVRHLPGVLNAAGLRHSPLVPATGAGDNASTLEGDRGEDDRLKEPWVKAAEKRREKPRRGAAR